MASDKKKSKAAKKPVPPAGGPFRHPDGDRRRRGGPSAKEAVKFKRQMREVSLPPEAGEAEG